MMNAGKDLGTAPAEYLEHARCSVNESTLLLHTSLFTKHTCVTPHPELTPNVQRAKRATDQN